MYIGFIPGRMDCFWSGGFQLDIRRSHPEALGVSVWTSRQHPDLWNPEEQFLSRRTPTSTFHCWTRSGVNFTNIFWAIFFTWKSNERLSVRNFLGRLEKAAHKMLVKLTTGISFINIREASFATKRCTMTKKAACQTLEVESCS